MSKKCRNCEKAEVLGKKETYLYTESGLPNVVLAGVEVRRCPSCGHHEVVLPRVTELHRTIAHAVIHKRSRLSGAEVRYLRKYLGWSGADFARHVGVDPSTVSNWENDKDPIGPSSDRLLRMMVAHGAQVDEYALDELAKIENEQKPPSRFGCPRRRRDGNACRRRRASSVDARRGLQVPCSFVDQGDRAIRPPCGVRSRASRPSDARLELLRLHPEILAAIAALPAGTPERLVTERKLRPVTRLPLEKQHAALGWLLRRKATG